MSALLEQVIVGGPAQFREQSELEGCDAVLRLRQDASAPGKRDQLVFEFKDPLLELVRLLREATEVEHALLVQYLYAAFSVKPQYQRIVGSAFSVTAHNLLGVAVQASPGLPAARIDELRERWLKRTSEQIDDAFGSVPYPSDAVVPP